MKIRALLAAALSGAVVVWLCAFAATSVAQPTSTSPLAPPPNGPRRLEPLGGLTVFENAVVHVKPGVTLEGASVITQNGLIVDVLEKPAGAAKIELPAETARSARVEDAAGLHIYPGFIDPYVEIDVPRPEPTAAGSHWNPRIMPQRSALDRGASGIDQSTAKTLRSMGFVAAGISPRNGIMRGEAAVISLSRPSPDPSDQRPAVLSQRTYLTIALNAGDGFGGEDRDDARWVRYPDSQMGVIALIRQTLLDADWQSRSRDAASVTPTTGALESLDPRLKTPLLWDTGNELESLRALRLAKEFDRPTIILGSGREYRRLAALAALKPQLIVPLTFPPRPRVGTPGELDDVDLNSLIAWEQAPTNPRRLDAAGLVVALTTSKTPDKLGGRAGFRDRLATAIKHGLAPDKALAMLTTNPASMLGLSAKLGTIEKGKLASFVVADGPLFTDRPDAPGPTEEGYVKPGKIIDVYIDGARHPVSERQPLDLRGDWAMTFDNHPELAGMSIRIGDANSVTIVSETADAGKTIRSSSKARDIVINPDGSFTLVFDHEPLGSSSVFQGSGIAHAGPDGTITLRGQFERAGGEPKSDPAHAPMRWTAKRAAAALPKPPTPASSPAADAKGFRPTPDALAGTWTLVLKDAQAKPDDPQHPAVRIGADKTIAVSRASEELKVTDVTFETKSDGPDTLITLIRYTVHGLTKDQPSTKVTLSPTDNRSRLKGSTAADGSQTFELARYLATPETDDIKSIPGALPLPVGAYGLKELPEQGSVLITNATVWTSAQQGIIEHAFVAFQGGKITMIGTQMPTLQGEWTIIDASGKHVTPGIIDCHSHTGISAGINEAGQAVTAEVRIGDITDPDSISWYRQLAGGVTCVNTLHGSANPIGGQNQVNKIRWGSVDPNDLHFEGAPAGIKFALGENVKQSNWGDRATTRYPQTRMGVESLIRDRFVAAGEYARQWAIYLASAGEPEAKTLPDSFVASLKRYTVSADDKSPAPPRPRRDLELEALAEILGGTRLIHCHSYRQDEILMLTRIAREFGFKIGTFQHILEGYKVADEVRDYSLGGSGFSDWWNYKVEVQDAIPYMGPIMHEVGVVVSYNSDSDELARRLNVEAGKALKYGGKSVTPAEALHFVTINPAKQLKIDDKVGSLEVGKQADVVIWSGPPMSTRSRAEKTWVDGRLLFSLERDADLRAAAAGERARIIQKILAQEKREKGGASTSRSVTASPPPEDASKPKMPPSVTSDDLSAAQSSGRRLLLQELLRSGQDAQRDLFLNMLRRGMDPRWARKGECGCGP